MVEFDPFDYGFHRDPYPTYAWLRDDAPLYHNERMGLLGAVALRRRPERAARPRARTRRPRGVAIEQTDAATKSMIEMDPPEHTQMRKLIARRFTPRRIAELEPRVREWTSALLDRLDGRDEFDVVHEFTALLPTTVVGTMLGISPDRHDDARQWTDDLLTREPGNPVPPPAAVGGFDADRDAGARARGATRRERPADDILSTLVQAEIDGQPLTDEQVIGFCLLLITGGHETTSKLIANGIRMFASHPDQREAVRAEPDLMAGAVEELLRYTSPTQYMARTTTRAVELHGVEMPAGAKVALLLGSGNRDPREFDRPDEFDIERPNPRTPCVRARRPRVPRRGGGAARGADRVAGVPRPVPALRGRRGRGRVPPLGQRAGSRPACR